MKHKVSLILFAAYLGYLANASTILAQEEPEQLSLTVTAASGLKLRKTPSSSGEVMSTIPVNETVVLDDGVNGKAEKLGGVKGKWVEITWKEQNGWAFSGYLRKKKNAPCLFQSGYSVYLAGEYALGEKALIMLDLDSSQNLKHKGGTIKYTEPAPPCTEIKMIIKGAKNKITTKENEYLGLLIRICSITVNSQGCEAGTGMTSITIKADLLEIKRKTYNN